MRLGHKVITNILTDDITSNGKKHVKGMFTADRNYKIACRLFYHFQIKGLQYERALIELQREFDLSELRLAQILMMDAAIDTLKDLKTRRADRKYLQSKFPFYNWY